LKNQPYEKQSGIHAGQVAAKCYFFYSNLPISSPLTIVAHLHQSLLRQGAGISIVFRLMVMEFFVFISSAFAQTAPASAGGDMQSSLMSMLPLVLMFVVLYFVMIRPQMKKQKEHRAMVDAVAKGDEVVSAGGLLGKVSKLGDVYLGLEIANGVEVQIQRSAVAQVLPKGTLK
jgi:preprotein translocase subunit YajC